MIGKFPFNDALANMVVEIARHTAQALVRIGHNHLRRNQAFPLRKGPRKSRIVYPGNQARIPQLSNGNLLHEIATIQKIETVRLPDILIRIMAAKRDERITVVRGSTRQAVAFENPSLNRPTRKVRLFVKVHPLQGDCVEIHTVKIQTHAGKSLNGYRHAPLVFNFLIARNHVRIRKNYVIQRKLYLPCIVGEHHLQAFRRIGCARIRQPVNRQSTLVNRMAAIAQTVALQVTVTAIYHGRRTNVATVKRGNFQPYR